MNHEHKGWTRLAPGVYDGNDGTLHLDIGEMLRASGFADTPENREMMVRTAREMMAQRGIPITED